MRHSLHRSVILFSIFPSVPTFTSEIFNEKLPDNITFSDSFFCNLQKQKDPSDTEEEKRKALLKMPDPNAAFVSDSLKYLLPILDTVLLRDQEYRISMQGKSKEQQQRIRKEIASNAGKIAENDKKNLQIVESIISKHGWLGQKDIGMKANATMFMVIQHADLKTQEKYLLY